MWINRSCRSQKLRRHSYNYTFCYFCKISQPSSIFFYIGWPWYTADIPPNDEYDCIFLFFACSDYEGQGSTFYIIFKIKMLIRSSGCHSPTKNDTKLFRPYICLWIDLDVLYLFRVQEAIYDG